MERNTISTGAEPDAQSLSRKLVSEAMGTFILVLGGTGAAVLAATFPGVGIGLVGVSLAFGLAVMAGIYALGSISGAHFNPAVTLGLAVSGRFAWREVPGYIVAQLAGAIFASASVLAIARGAPGGYSASLEGLAANGFGAHSPGGYGVAAAFFAEAVLTFIFVSVVLACTRKTAPAGFAGLAIGLTLTLVHLVGIPVTNVSVNPARSTGPAILAGSWAVAQLWLFWVAPLAGAAVAGAAHLWLHDEVPRREREIDLERPLHTH